jgi:hypothetical protein
MLVDALGLNNCDEGMVFREKNTTKIPSGLIYTVQEVLHAYIWTKEIGFQNNRYNYSHDFTVILPFMVVGAILWLLSIIKKQKLH